MNPRLVALGVGAAVLIVVLGFAARRVSVQARRVQDQDMGLMDHLRELRYRLLAAMAAIALVAVALFSFDITQSDVFGPTLWLPVPSLTQSLAGRGLDLLLSWALPDFVQIVVLSPSEALLAQFQASIIGALLIASPFVAYHVAAFVAPALLPGERRAIGTLAPLAFVLFVAGVAFALFVMVPVTLTTLYAYAEPLGAEAFARPHEIVSFILLAAALFGAAFETPLVMTGLSYAGILAASTMARHWRGVVVGILLVGAVVTDPSPVTQMIVAIPLLGLYLLGLLGARLAWPAGRRRRAARRATSTERRDDHNP